MSSSSAVSVFKVGKELVQGVRECNAIADLWGAAFVVCYGFDASPQAAGFIVSKVPLNALIVHVFGISNALLPFCRPPHLT